MTENKSKAKDFFLHLGMMVSLYTGTVALLNLLFRVINVAYPQIDGYYGRFGSNISFPVATLLVVFPLFLVLANIINKGYVADPSRKDFAFRNWLVYITLFIAGAVITGDLVTLVYFFLDGRDITMGFLLKVLAVFVVSGVIFGYFLDDLKNKLTTSRRNIWRVVALALVLGSVIVGFIVIGSPKSQRLMRYDEQKVTDLQNLQSQIVNYWQSKEALPLNLEALRDSLSFYDSNPLDPQTQTSYEYTQKSSLVFELCAVFNKKSVEGTLQVPSKPYYVGGLVNENWIHGEGRFCFERTIDPERYPQFKNY